MGTANCSRPIKEGLEATYDDGGAATTDGRGINSQDMDRGDSEQGATGPSNPLMSCSMKLCELSGYIY